MFRCFNPCCRPYTPPTPPFPPINPFPPTPPTPPVINTSCIATSQMNNIIRQINTIYPGTTVTFGLENGTTITGNIGSILPTNTLNGGIVEVLDPTTSTRSNLISIDKISYLLVPNQTYLSSFRYLPNQANQNCPITNTNSWLNVVTIGSTITLEVLDSTTITGTVVANQPGMIVLTSGTDLYFINTQDIISLNTTTP